MSKQSYCPRLVPYDAPTVDEQISEVAQGLSVAQMCGPLRIFQGQGHVLGNVVLPFAIDLRNLKARPRMAPCAPGEDHGYAIPITLLEQSLAQVETGVGIALVECGAEEPLPLPRILLHTARHALGEEATQPALRPHVAELRGVAVELKGARHIDLEARALRRLPSPLREEEHRLDVVLGAGLCEPLHRCRMVARRSEAHGPAHLGARIAGLGVGEVPWRGARRHSLRRVLEDEAELEEPLVLLQHLHPMVQVPTVHSNLSSRQGHEPALA
mmetsp:Transcript_3434/g.9898  ORF Transcript_3434/g.9898 Transcript_3434/m.9898 type:complete len:271 (+) Transcript_3434:828-1640(+)